MRLRSDPLGTCSQPETRPPVPPAGEWHSALFAAYGDSLRGGVLVTSGVLSREGAEELARGDYPDGLTSPLSFKALVLEQWCRQMATLA